MQSSIPTTPQNDELRRKWNLICDPKGLKSKYQRMAVFSPSLPLTKSRSMNELAEEYKSKSVTYPAPVTPTSSSRKGRMVGFEDHSAHSDISESIRSGGLEKSHRGLSVTSFTTAWTGNSYSAHDGNFAHSSRPPDKFSPSHSAQTLSIGSLFKMVRVRRYKRSRIVTNLTYFDYDSEEEYVDGVAYTYSRRQLISPPIRKTVSLQDIAQTNDRLSGTTLHTQSSFNSRSSIVFSIYEGSNEASASPAAVPFAFRENKTLMEAARDGRRLRRTLSFPSYDYESWKANERISSSFC